MGTAVGLLLKAGYMGTVLVMRSASYFPSMVEESSVNVLKRIRGDQKNSKKHQKVTKQIQKNLFMVVFYDTV